jgi:hypothetical protein
LFFYFLSAMTFLGLESTHPGVVAKSTLVFNAQQKYISGSVDLTSTHAVTGVLPVANGGTGNNVLRLHGVLVGSGSEGIRSAPNLEVLDESFTIGGGTEDWPSTFTFTTHGFAFISEDNAITGNAHGFEVTDENNNGSEFSATAVVFNDDEVLTRTKLGSTVKESSLETLGPQQQPLNMGGNCIENAATPTHSTDVATKGYVDAVAQGLNVKESCLVSLTSSIDLTATYNSLEGVALVQHNRVLLRNQTDAKQNGIYVVNASRHLERAADFLQPTSGAYTFVESESKSYVLVTLNPIVVGTTPLTFTLFSTSSSSSSSETTFARLPQLVVSASCEATLDRFLLVESLTADITITLPHATLENAGKFIKISRLGDFKVTIVPPSGQNLGAYKNGASWELKEFNTLLFESNPRWSRWSLV